MTQSNSIRISFRLSRGEISLLRPGLNWISGNHARWERQGKASARSLDHLFFGAPKKGEYHPEMMAVIKRALEATENFSGKTKRMHFDALELAACVLGVRATAKLVRHGHIKSPPRYRRGAVRKLLRKLERLRKRAKRAFIRMHGSDAFSRHQSEWQQFVQFAGMNFLFCRCNRSLSTGISARSIRKRIVQDWMGIFRRELAEEGCKVPPDVELRNLVRRAIRAARRLSVHLGLRDIPGNRRLLNERIRGFVFSRCRPVSEEEAA